MTDPRVIKLAKVLAHHSLEIKPGQRLIIYSSPLVEELTLAVYEEAIKAGAFVHVQSEVYGTREIFYKNASDAQLDDISPIEKMIDETFDASLYRMSKENTRALSGVDSTRIARASKAYAPIEKIFLRRAARKELRWCITAYPCQVMAQEADMSLHDYQDFVYGAGMLHLDNPAAHWKEEGKRQQKFVE